LNYKTDQSKFDLDRFYFDEKAADSAVRYIESNIRHVKGELAGQLLRLEEWQKNEIIRPLFGWKKKHDGTRKFSSAYVEVPKKSGKSFIAASMAAIFLDIDREGGSEIVGVAWGRKQASLVFDATKEVIKKSPRLNKKCKVFRNTITAPDHTGGTKKYHILSKEAGAEDGLNPQLAVIDELHEHKNSNVVEMVEKSMAARKQPLSFIITTAGSDLYGIGHQRHQYGIDVVNGLYEDDNLLVCIYGADKDDDPFDEEVWKKVNPNYGVSVYKEAYEREAAKARGSSASLNSFKRYYLNIWTQSADGWISDVVWQESSKYKDKWTLRADIELEVIKLGLNEYPCYGGLDLSSRSDITAFTLLWDINGQFYSLNWFWLPEDKGTHSADEKNIQYREWVEKGYITETEGNVVDYDFVIHKIKELGEIYDIKSIAYDPYNSQHIAPKLEEVGAELVEFRQGFLSMNAPSKELEAAIMSKRFEHFSNPVLRWMAGNAEVATDPAGNIKIIKDRNRPEKKVDGIISNVMAYGLAIDSSEKGSYLEEGELFII
jgi:phage terminase large subunit-like protein